eukprot:COSAG02_NODE_6831_length_3339_cov_25.590123_4_plen_102_part_00
MDILSQTHEVVDVSLQRCLLNVRTRFRDELASYCEDVSADGVGIPCSIPKWMSKFLLASFHHIPITRERNGYSANPIRKFSGTDKITFSFWSEGSGVSRFG